VPYSDLAGEELPIACPFCGAKLAVSHEPPSVMHTLPVCATFSENDPTEFLRKVRLALQDG
jgi:hypothetical protein